MAPDRGGHCLGREGRHHPAGGLYGPPDRPGDRRNAARGRSSSPLTADGQTGMARGGSSAGLATAPGSPPQSCRIMIGQWAHVPAQHSDRAHIAVHGLRATRASYTEPEHPVMCGRDCRELTLASRADRRLHARLYHGPQSHQVIPRPPLSSSTWPPLARSGWPSSLIALIAFQNQPRGPGVAHGGVVLMPKTAARWSGSGPRLSASSSQRSLRIRSSEMP